jgi:hypothetical protein
MVTPPGETFGPCHHKPNLKRLLEEHDDNRRLKAIQHLVKTDLNDAQRADFYNHPIFNGYYKTHPRPKD